MQNNKDIVEAMQSTKEDYKNRKKSSVGSWN